MNEAVLKRRITSLLNSVCDTEKQYTKYEALLKQAKSKADKEFYADMVIVWEKKNWENSVLLENLIIELKKKKGEL